MDPTILADLIFEISRNERGEYRSTLGNELIDAIRGIVKDEMNARDESDAEFGK